MNITIAIDSFKGCMTSAEAGISAAEGIRRVIPDADINVLPLADGGEGTVEALVSGTDGKYRTVTVSDPLGRPVRARYGILRDNTAVIEMSSASGITLLDRTELNPMKTTTAGTGQMILDAVRHGCRNFIIGIGGSATNDGGIGCMQALGFEISDINGNQVPYGAAGCSQVYSISDRNVPEELRECTFHVACDVKNPLCGEYGCSAVFARQKGADDEMIAVMDSGLKYFSEKVRLFRPSADPDHPGSGAAGGLGFALVSFLGAELSPGAELIIRKTGLEEKIRNSDIVVTGEGRIDAQTVMGKAPACVAATAEKYGKKVIAFCGSVGPGAEECNSAGITAFFPVIRNICTLGEATDNQTARSNLADTAEQVFRLLV